MIRLKLQPDEAMILQEVGVAHGTSTRYSDELYLTTRNIYYVDKGVFGNTKNIVCYPLSQLKIVDGYPQVMQGKKSNGLSTLDIYFTNGGETFSFRGKNKPTIKKWVKEINKTLGYDEFNDTGTSATTMGELKGAFNDAMSELGIHFQLGKKKSQTIINKKCISCSAPLMGYKGQLIHCKYCDTDQTM